jgi:hypothetical protein
MATKSIAEIRSIITRMEEQRDAELLADVPGAVRERVRPACYAIGAVGSR